MEKHNKPSALYLGTNTKYNHENYNIFHYPVIQINPRDPEEHNLKLAFEQFHLFSHIIFTSKNAAKICCDMLPYYDLTIEDLQAKKIITVGKVTAKVLIKKGIKETITPKNRHAEGIIRLLDNMQLKASYILWPRSSHAGNIIGDYLDNNDVRHISVDLYDTSIYHPDPLPDLNNFEAIIFSSPPTIDAFIKIFGKIPTNKKVITIGSATTKYITKTSKEN